MLAGIPLANLILKEAQVIMKPTNQREKMFAPETETVDTACAQRNEEWTREQLGVLVEYAALYWDGAHTNGWPSTKNHCFWDDCATPFEQSTGQQRQTG